MIVRISDASAMKRGAAAQAQAEAVGVLPVVYLRQIIRDREIPFRPRSAVIDDGLGGDEVETTVCQCVANMTSAIARVGGGCRRRRQFRRWQSRGTQPMSLPSHTRGTLP
jgi:hypothetical protein